MSLPWWLAAAVYAALLLALGALAQRRTRRTPEEYFLAGRRLGTAVLFMALFGTNATAFVLVGIPGLAYHQGVGVFGLNASIVALGIPLTFWAIGSPARRMGARLGALTPAELYARRFGSRRLGLLLFALFTLYTIPYMVTAVHGAAVTVGEVSDGAVPEWAGGAGVLVVALGYTAMGGMRATAWTNVLQGLIFLVFLLVACVLVAGDLGGFAAATERVAERDPRLLSIPPDSDFALFRRGGWTSWGLAIATTVIAFPHMLVRLMAARDERSLKRIALCYPPALALLWLPAVLIGVWGAAAVPGLVGRESDRILAEMVARHSAGLATFGVLAVLAAVMSTLDAQILTLSSMLSRDVLDPWLGRGRAHDDVRSGRLFAVLVCALVFGLWRVSGSSIFDVAAVAFSGYVTLVPALWMGVRWRRATAAGLGASMLAGGAVYGALLAAGGSLAAVREPSGLGLLPVAWAFLAAALAGLAGSLLGRPPDAGRTARAFGDAAA